MQRAKAIFRFGVDFYGRCDFDCFSYFFLAFNNFNFDV
jgi:hypothetical protein